MIKLLKKIFGTRNDRVIKNLAGKVKIINSMEESFSKLSDDDLKNKTIDFKNRLQSGEKLEDILPEAFATVREASKRTIGLRHFDVQLVGGMILNSGKIAEMKTGEGKTLVATLPVYLNALEGKGVHVVTVNDYLAKRDSEWMGPIFRFLGLEVGLVQTGSSYEKKKKAYLSDITYVTNNELGFDYLRDNMVVRREDRVLRELNFAIIDEVDSILIDEARTPLIISGAAEKSTDKYYVINKIVPLLKGKFVTEDEQIDAKFNHLDLTIGFDYVVDKKNNNVFLTGEGIKKCENILGVENLYNDVESEWVHHIHQALKAHNLFKKDVDYVVKDGEIVIVDEFTGRLMPGRRWSDGMHQALEAKENLKIAEENQTLATITFQNFFRMYKKLAGMTGTAITEADEFFEIYKLDVVEIPTNKPILRKDYQDVIYMTEKEKYNAIIKDIIENKKIGRPVLVGTKSIEKSEYLSSLLKKNGVSNQVLNAKYHEMEANIIAQAGKKGAVTIATNMAGRGTDIVLGGNPTDAEEADYVKRVGGLYIIGTERHDSRRIDNQLRGRSGRQGDPGASKFYISLEDDLMKLFGTDKRMSMFSKLGIKEGEDIQHPWISKIIEGAQRRVEGMNFDIRKHLIEFDNVMNKQREVVYGQRDMLLFADDLNSIINDIIDDVTDLSLDKYFPQKISKDAWDLLGLKNWFKQNANIDLEDKFLEKVLSYPREGIIDTFRNFLKDNYKKKVESFSSNIILELHRMILLQIVDNSWKEHLYNLDQLRRVIGFRAYGQKDPILEYKNEAYKFFINMINKIKQSSFEYIYKIDLNSEVFSSQDTNFNNTKFHTQKDIFNEDLSKKNNLSVRNEKVGRNDLCPCGSGKKYKKCCGK